MIRWCWGGDSRGGCGACRSWYQWTLHWHVWKNGHLPPRGADRCFNTRRHHLYSVCLDMDIQYCFQCLNPLCTFSGICEDYRLLENMNKLTSLKYMEMKDISVNISRNLQDLNNKCEQDLLLHQILIIFFSVQMSTYTNSLIFCRC